MMTEAEIEVMKQGAKEHEGFPAVKWKEARKNSSREGVHTLIWTFNLQNDERIHFYF